MKSIRSNPIWTEFRMPTSARLSGRRRFDVVVIGGGITGLTAAWFLKRAGKKVGVLERDRLASADTAHTTAHLTMVTDLRLKDLVKNLGKAAARLTWQGGVTAVNTIEKIADQLGIDCEFRRVPAFLMASLDSERDEREELQTEAELARELGFEADYLDAVPYFGRPGVRFPNQAKFQPRRYLAGLAAAIKGDGSAIFEESEVTEVTAEKGEAFQVACGDAVALADYLVIATHVPMMGVTGLVSATLLQTKIYPYSSYVVSGTLPHGVIPEACFWDTSDPYYYLRIEAGQTTDGFIFGGLDHKTGQVADAAQRLDDLRTKVYSRIPEARIDHQWSGQIIESNDGLPLMGETAVRQFVATGFNGNGITFGTLGAMLACDAALGRDNPWQQLFSVDRKKFRGGTLNYVAENVDFPYYFLAGTLSPASRESPGSLQRGEGKVLSINGERAACSRDSGGQLHVVSAVCTHLGCVVAWNDAEHTWDCPCHGSRFHATGEVLAGPAESPLEPVQWPTDEPAKPRSRRTPRKKAAAAPKRRAAAKGATRSRRTSAR